MEGINIIIIEKAGERFEAIQVLQRSVPRKEAIIKKEACPLKALSIGKACNQVPRSTARAMVWLVMLYKVGLMVLVYIQVQLRPLTELKLVEHQSFQWAPTQLDY